MAKQGSEERTDFDDKVRASVAHKAMYVCSNPTCLRVTGFLKENGGARAIGQVAHVRAAAKGGPRGKVTVHPDGTELKVDEERNAIWLCTPCHYMIDQDYERYPVVMLLEWKQQHEERISGLVNLDLEDSLLRLGANRRHHDLVRDLLYWLDDHRFMYFEDSREFPEQVFEAVQAFRGKIIQLRSQLHSGPLEVADALGKLSSLVSEFLDDINEIDVRRVTVSSGNPDFERFSIALAKLRVGVKAVIKPLDPNFKFQNISFKCS